MRSDHLDVVGHFSSKRIQGTSDWLPSGSHMNDERFETCWDAVAQFLCEDWRPLEEEDKGLEQVAEPKP